MEILNFIVPFIILLTVVVFIHEYGHYYFAEKNIAGIVSQVLILGSIDKEGKVILVHPSQKSENGLPIA